MSYKDVCYVIYFMENRTIRVIYLLWIAFWKEIGLANNDFVFVFFKVKKKKMTIHSSILLLLLLLFNLLFIL